MKSQQSEEISRKLLSKNGGVRNEGTLNRNQLKGVGGLDKKIFNNQTKTTIAQPNITPP